MDLSTNAHVIRIIVVTIYQKLRQTYKEEPLSLFWKTDGDYGIRIGKT